MRGVGVLGESFGSYDSVGVKGVTDGGVWPRSKMMEAAPHGEKQRAGARVY